jgi:hypothetical protein
MTTTPTIGGWTLAATLGTSASTTISPAANVGSGGVQIGDWIVCVLESSDSLANTKKPTMTGWTTLLALAGMSGSATSCFGVYARKRLSGDAPYPVTQTTAESAPTWSRMIFVRGAGDISQWVVGTFTPRATNATTTTAVATSITTTVANSLGLAVAGERTVAAETDAQVSVANFTKLVSLVSNVDAILIAATKSLPTPGAAGAVTFTFPNAHAQNAIAGTLGIPPIPDSTPGMPIKVSDGTVLEDSRLQVSSGTALYTPRAIKKVNPGYASVTAMLAGTFYCAHRGGSRDWPEMSAYAYGQSAIHDYPALELSLARTSDGVWFGLHDDSLDRTSLGSIGTTLVPASMTWAQVQTHQILGSVAVNNPTQPNRPYMRWEELMAVYYTSHVIFVDPKVAIANRAELLDLMDAMPGDPQERFVGKYSGVSGGVGNTSGWAYDLAQRGYKSWGYFYETELANYTTYAPRWDILGQEYTASQSAWNALKAAAPGKPVMAHICPDAVAVSTAIAKGANGAMVSSPLNTPLTTA